MTDWMELLAIAGRTALIYGAILLLLRLIGRRQIGQSTPSDLVTLLLVSEAVQNGMLNDDSSLTGALVAATTLLAISYAIDWLCLRFPRFERWIEGDAFVAYDGKSFNERRLRRENITQRDLISALRAHGEGDLDGLRLVVIEPDGKVSVLKKLPAAEFDPRSGG
ncbi:DUF421 domain-containing protein [Ferrovibrio sp.]|uniref:DUF421 domain-containing protein n=1 Tax=Ferrovibrio sp. TaxID=1917215 RepID=UPI000CB12A56|nr:YetF domain-containing protein [Ferrovibrio sp.]PJI37617.1 MAG: hypothetical protein CTR53_19220 [Ferrovibrio sp.]